MQVIQQNEATAALRRVYFRLMDVDGAEVTGATPTGRVSKNGGATAAAAGTFAEVDAGDDPGLYYYEATAGEVDTLGALVVSPVATGAVRASYEVLVVEYAPTTQPESSADIATAVAAEIGTGSALTALASAADLATVAAFIDTEITAIDTVVDSILALLQDGSVGLAAIEGLVDELETRLTATRAGFLDLLSTGVTINVSTRAAIADALLARSIAGGADGGRTVEQALAVLRNRVTLAGGTLTVYDTDDSTVLFTAAYTTASRDALASVDPV